MAAERMRVDLMTLQEAEEQLNLWEEKIRVKRFLMIRAISSPSGSMYGLTNAENVLKMAGELLSLETAATHFSLMRRTLLSEQKSITERRECNRNA